MKQHHTLNPNLSFQVKDGGFIATNHETHRSFKLDQTHLKRLLDWSLDSTLNAIDIDYKLLAEKFIIPKELAHKGEEWPWDRSSRLFHVATKIENKDPLSSTEFVQKYKNSCKEADQNEAPLYVARLGESTLLPPYDKDKLQEVSFEDTLQHRKTCRVFNDEAISLEELSTLLFITFGEYHPHEDPEFASKKLKRLHIRKTSPSAGGLHCNEAYVLVRNVDGLKSGIYHYNVKNHALTYIDKLEKSFDEYVGGQFFANNLAIGVFLVSYMQKLAWKYSHPRSYRMALADAGHLSQTFHLGAAALQLQSWVTGIFDDDLVSRDLRLQSAQETPLLFLGLGKGTCEAIPKEFTRP